MSTHKKIDIICCIAVVFALLVTVLFMNAEALGIQAADKVMGYEERLFDETQVHTIDIIIEDWESFLATCQSEEYSVCNVLIDGEAYTNVGIRGKGNTSLSTVSSMDSDRYSFKIEFDQYDSAKNYYGLDKLCLNNIIQDNTYMKDFLAYQMMEEFGVDAPLCSYVYITVNGEDWGLYLAVEGIEDSFLQRNYGNDYGELYKPDSMSFGGGRGNGKDFNMEDFDFSRFENSGSGESDQFGGEMPDMSGMFGGEMPEGMKFPGGNMQMPEGMTIPEGAGNGDFATENEESGNGSSESRRDFSNMMGGFGGGGFGMGSSDVKLQYIDDNASSYSNIFNNAKTDITEADEQRLIASLKELTEGEDIASVVDVEEVIRYFVVHNFLVNGDSYTGSMIHNYYLYEEDGKLSMIPWDYNLAYGTFQGSNAGDTVNDPIDSPVSGSMEDRPMVNWIFASEEYTELYHQYFAEFIETYYTNGELAELIDYTAKLIAPYVEKDPTKFCTYEEFETGVEAMREFCNLRLESVVGQLDGTIPSTSEGQSADSSSLVDASGLNISDLGTMGGMGGMGGGGFGGMGGFGGDRGNRGDKTESSDDSVTKEDNGATVPDAGDMSDMFGGEMPDMGDMFGGEMPDMGNMPWGGDTSGGGFPGGNMQMPQGGGWGNRGETSDDDTNTTRPDMNGTEMPDMENMKFPVSEGTESRSSVSTEAVVLLAASLVCLLVGMLVAYKYKR